ncbi:MAG: hypothetical protein ACHQVS_03180 [Candidatus Babeliales bacterium]
MRYVACCILIITPFLAFAAAERKKLDILPSLYSITVSMDPKGIITFYQLHDDHKKQFHHLYKKLKARDLLIRTTFTIQPDTAKPNVLFPIYLPADLFKDLKQKNGDSVRFKLNNQKIKAQLHQRPSDLLFEDVFTESTHKAYGQLIVAGDGCCDDCCGCCCIPL